MQEKFILDVETRGKEDIEQKKKKKDALADDICVCTKQMKRQVMLFLV